NMETPYVVVVSRKNSHRSFCISCEVLDRSRQLPSISITKARTTKATYTANRDARRCVLQGQRPSSFQFRSRRKNPVSESPIVMPSLGFSKRTRCSSLGKQLAPGNACCHIPLIDRLHRVTEHADAAPVVSTEG